MPASCRDCPIPGTGCQCLQAHAADQDAYAAALHRVSAPSQPARLRVVTMGADQRPGCTQDLTCPCESCVGDRHGRTALGAGAAALRVRPMSPRHRRAA